MAAVVVASDGEVEEVVKVDEAERGVWFDEEDEDDAVEVEEREEGEVKGCGALLEWEGLREVVIVIEVRGGVMGWLYLDA